MAHFARITDGTVTDVHVLADDETGGAAFLADLWGGDPADYIPADDIPVVGAAWDGKAFVPPASEYERGKADGAAEQVALSVAQAL